ncbi:GTP-binding protein [Tulasnella sp. JGI-2019a]|nr:GTP-binding protein [Tulasnella sp. JGI-2019a]KAG9002144.1 GTP-binding protein [Tulasnella sp. JGI-2019a]
MFEVDASGRIDDLRVQSEVLTFDGSDTSDVTTFLQNVKRVAFSQGRQRDNDWLVDYAEASLTGDALRWFHELEEETVDSWKALRGAFLHRFKKPIPVSAPAAAPMSPAIPIKPNTQPLTRVLPPTSIYTENPQDTRKILIVGDSGVGKSSLLARYLCGVWMPSMPPTIGIHYETCGEKRGEDILILHVWDASGADQYNTLRMAFYAGTDRIWIVYDVTNRNSFESVSSWIHNVKSSGSAAILCLLANKCDLLDERVVTGYEGRKLATESGGLYVEVSAKSNEGIQGFRGNLLPKFE